MKLSLAQHHPEEDGGGRFPCIDGHLFYDVERQIHERQRKYEEECVLKIDMLMKEAQKKRAHDDETSADGLRSRPRILKEEKTRESQEEGEKCPSQIGNRDVDMFEYVKKPEIPRVPKDAEENKSPEPRCLKRNDL